jgi:hypothetical protein
MSIATRTSVHGSAGKPLASAPAISSLSKRSLSAAVLPSRLLLHACTSSASAAAHFDVVCRLTPCSRATSACVTPRAGMCISLRREISFS